MIHEEASDRVHRNVLPRADYRPDGLERNAGSAPLVVLTTATAEETAGNSYFGLAIGFTITVGAFAGGPISGGAFNPAVGIGPILWDAAFGGGSIGDLWLYLVGPLVGGWLAAVVFRAQHAAAD